jgi:lactate permease
MNMSWLQVYDPLHNALLSTACAALPVVVLLGALGLFHVKAHWAAILGLATALIVAVAVFGMPGSMAGMAALNGIFFGLFPIGWIILNIIFLYTLTVDKGLFKVLQESITGITVDRRLQLLLIAFCFGAFFEGAAGFGTPVAVTGAVLIGLGFSPLAASGLSLIANTAPVAFGALGAPIQGLHGVTGIDSTLLGAQIGRLLPFFSLLVPFWLITAFAGFRRMLEVWPAILVAGLSFAVAQFVMSNYHGPYLVDVVASVFSMLCLAAFLRIWHPKRVMTSVNGRDPDETAYAPAAGILATGHGHEKGVVIQAWIPWLILSVIVFIWGLDSMKGLLNHIWSPKWSVPGLDKLVFRTAPVVPKNTAEGAVYTFNLLSMTGTAIFVSSIIAGFVMGYRPGEMLRKYGAALKLTRYSLMTIAAMMALGFVTRYSGTDATMGLAFAHTGVLYPFFGTMLGWLGVALTGSDTSSNVLFGSLQTITAHQIGLSPTLMAGANSAGGVMGKMIDAQSIVVASTATQWYGHEGDILRYVFFHSIALAALVGIEVFLFAYVSPFTSLVVR